MIIDHVQAKITFELKKGEIYFSIHFFCNLA